jgi:hypothetical protein
MSSMLHCRAGEKPWEELVVVRVQPRGFHEIDKRERTVGRGKEKQCVDPVSFGCWAGW